MWRYVPVRTIIQVLAQLILKIMIPCVTWTASYGFMSTVGPSVRPSVRPSLHMPVRMWSRPPVWHVRIGQTGRGTQDADYPARRSSSQETAIPPMVPGSDLLTGLSASAGSLAMCCKELLNRAVGRLQSQRAARLHRGSILDHGGVDVVTVASRSGT